MLPIRTCNLDRLGHSSRHAAGCKHDCARNHELQSDDPEFDELQRLQVACSVRYPELAVARTRVGRSRAVIAGWVTSRGRRGLVVMQESPNGDESRCESDVDDNKKAKKTSGEMEMEFLQALQSFYFDSKPIMPNEEFDNLKEELTWERSSIVTINSDEQKFLEVSLCYAAGEPILSDQEFDELKLKQKGSKVAIAGPRCSLRKKEVSDTTVDYLKMTLLDFLAALIALGFVLFLDDITGFEITYLLELLEPYSFFFTLCCRPHS